MDATDQRGAIVGEVEYLGAWNPSGGSIIVRVISGVLDVGMHLETEDQRHRFTVRSFVLVNAPEAYAEGKRVISVHRLSDGDLIEGSRLVVTIPQGT